MKHLRRFNENNEETHPYAIHMRIVYKQVLDTIRECFLEFEDNEWQWITTPTNINGEVVESISIWGFPNFNCRMVPKEEIYIPSEARTEFIDMTGEMRTNGQISWNSQQIEFQDNPSIEDMTDKEAELERAEQDSRRHKIKEQLDDFMTAIKRLHSDLGVDFRFSFNNGGGEFRIIIQGAV